jgi:citrate lyase subunit beta/citryl-CoA lyase
LRSILFVADEGKVSPACASAADALLFDLAALGPEVSARAIALARGSGKTTLVQIQPLASGRADRDLDAIMSARPEGIVLPQACGGRDVQHLGAKLAVREAENDLPDGATKILAFVAETPASLFELGSLARSTRRLIGLGWRPESLGTALGAADGAEPLRVARSMLLFAAAAAGVPAFDALQAGEGKIFAWACEAAARDGFSGKFVRDAAQAAAVNTAFNSLSPLAGRGQG